MLTVCSTCTLCRALIDFFNELYLGQNKIIGVLYLLEGGSLNLNLVKRLVIQTLDQILKNTLAFVIFPESQKRTIPQEI